MNASDLGLVWLEEMDPPLVFGWSDPGIVNASWRELLATPGPDPDFRDTASEADLFFATVRDIDHSPVASGMREARLTGARLALRLALGGTEASVRSRIESMSPTMAYVALTHAFLCAQIVVRDADVGTATWALAASTGDQAVPVELLATVGGAEASSRWAAAVDRLDDMDAFLSAVTSHRIAPVDVHDALAVVVHRLTCVVAATLPGSLGSIRDGVGVIDWI